MIAAETERRGVPAPFVRLFSCAFGGTESFARSAAVVTALVLLAKVVALSKDIALARTFGTSDEFDAFLVAFTVPQFVVSLTSGTLNSALIPSYLARKRKLGAKEAGLLASDVSLLLFVATIIGCIGVFLSAGWIVNSVASGFGAEKRQLAAMLLRLLSVSVILTGAASNMGAVLNAERKFHLTAFLPGINAAITTAIVIAGVSTLGIYAVPTGLVAGNLIEIWILSLALKQRGIEFPLKWSRACNQEVGYVFRQYAPAVVGAALLGFTSVITQSGAAKLGSGSVVILNYGTKFVSIVSSVFVLAVGTTIFSHLSDHSAASDWRSLKGMVLRASAYSGTVTGSFAVVVWIASEWIVHLLYSAASFPQKDIAAIVAVQRYFVLQIPVYVIGVLLSRGIAAMHGNVWLLGGNIISLTALYFLSSWAAAWKGTAGLAAATSGMYAISAAYLSIVFLIGIQRRIRADQHQVIGRQ